MKCHAVIAVHLKNLSTVAVIERPQIRIEIEDPSDHRHWLSLIPDIWQFKPSDIPPETDERSGEQRFSFPDSAESHTPRSIEEAIILSHTSDLLRVITVPLPTQAGGAPMDYYERIKPFALRVRMTVTYLPGVHGAKEEQIEKTYRLEPECAAREDHPAEVAHPGIVTGWHLTPLSPRPTSPRRYSLRPPQGA